MGNYLIHQIIAQILRHSENSVDWVLPKAGRLLKGNSLWSSGLCPLLRRSLESLVGGVIILFRALPHRVQFTQQILRAQRFCACAA